MTKRKKNKAPVRLPGYIKFAAKALEAVSPALAARFAIKLFTTPIKFKLPKREMPMDAQSTQSRVFIKAVGQTVNVYRLGNSSRKVVVVHGWSGRGTQLYSIAESLVARGFETISFDAPAHGKSTGKASDMTQFMATILQLEQEMGPFEYAVGHSLGAMAVLNSIKRGLQVKKAVTIGSGDVVEDIMLGFSNQLGMKIATGRKMIARFEQQFDETINNYSAYVASKDVHIPVLIFHDENDRDVPVKAAHHIAAHLSQPEVVITHGLGHRKILGNKEVIDKINQFLT